MDGGNCLEVIKVTGKRWADIASVTLMPLRRFIMPSAGKPSLYERLGGVYSIATVVDDLIDKVMADPRLNAILWWTKRIIVCRLRDPSIW